MAKKNVSYVKSNRTSRKRSTSVQRPVGLTIDQLCELSDDDLFRQAMQLRADIDTVRRDRCDSSPWEIELCYVQRELDLRKNRKRIQFDVDDRDFVSEDHLPMADLDNTEFTGL